MALVWAVPVVAAAVAAAVVATAARPLEDALGALVEGVRAVGDLRRPLGVVRAEVADSDALVAGFDRRHAAHPPADGVDATEGGGATP